MQVFMIISKEMKSLIVVIHVFVEGSSRSYSSNQSG